MPSSSWMPVAQALQRHSGGWKQAAPAKPAETDPPTITPDPTEPQKAQDCAADERAQSPQD